MHCLIVLYNDFLVDVCKGFIFTPSVMIKKVPTLKLLERVPVAEKEIWELKIEHSFMKCSIINVSKNTEDKNVQENYVISNNYAKI